MSKVYHDKRFPAIGRDTRSFPEDFVEVAELATEDLGEIFQLTNHIDQDWSLNEGVRKIVDGPVRSTSVGDVVALSSGAVLLCRTLGWKEVGKVNGGPLPLTFTTGMFEDLPPHGEQNESPPTQ